MELVCINKYETCQMWKLLLIIWVVRHVCPNLSTVANRLAGNVGALCCWGLEFRPPSH